MHDWSDGVGRTYFLLVAIWIVLIRDGTYLFLDFGTMSAGEISLSESSWIFFFENTQCLV